MNRWRPPQHIRVIAIGLHWRDGRLLALEVNDDGGDLKGVRPLGGGVEFGESWQEALIREFREELNLDVTITGAPLVLENIYTHEGRRGHEIVFVAEIELPGNALIGQEVINFAEDRGTLCTACWFDLDDLKARNIALYPDGLATALGR